MKGNDDLLKGKLEEFVASRTAFKEWIKKALQTQQRITEDLQKG